MVVGVTVLGGYRIGLRIVGSIMRILEVVDVSVVILVLMAWFGSIIAE